MAGPNTSVSSIKHHFIREKVNDGTIELKYCPTDEMVADMLTKGLPQQQFCIFTRKGWTRLCKAMSEEEC